MLILHWQRPTGAKTHMEGKQPLLPLQLYGNMFYVSLTAMLIDN